MDGRPMLYQYSVHEKQHVCTDFWPKDSNFLQQGWRDKAFLSTRSVETPSACFMELVLINMGQHVTA